MYGTLAGALSGRKIPFDRQLYTATVDGRIVGIGKTIRIQSITVHYDLTIPAESRTAAERALHISSSTDWSSPVMLSAAKHLIAVRARPFAECTLSATNVLRVTWCDCSN